jgi:tRNA nucleotidyltransferase (CCA-adding enzyme)
LIDNIERFWGHEEASAEISKYVFIRLGYKEDFINKLYILIKYHDHKTYPNEESLTETINLVGKDLIPYLFKFQTADLLSHNKKYCNILLPILNETIVFYNKYYLGKDNI